MENKPNLETGLPDSLMASKVRRRLLQVLLSEPQSRFYVRQLHKLLGGSVGTLHREIRRIEAEGVVVSERVGNRRFYFANPEYAYLDQVKSALAGAARRPASITVPSFPHLTRNETVALERTIHAARAVFGPAVVQVVVFGSKVRGDFGPESDIDVLVVVREKNWDRIDQLYRLLVDIELDHSARLSVKILTEREYLKNKSMGSPFVAAVESEGVAV